MHTMVRGCNYSLGASDKAMNQTVINGVQNSLPEDAERLLRGRFRVTK